MADINSISIINSASIAPIPTSFGSSKTICNHGLCGAKKLFAALQVVAPDKTYNLSATHQYHLVSVTQASGNAVILYGRKTHKVEQGDGLFLAPEESATIQTACNSELKLLHLIVQNPPKAVEAGLRGGPGYLFSARPGTEKILRKLRDASGRRVREFWAESTIKLANGDRLTESNAVQAGSMLYLPEEGEPEKPNYYKPAGASPYHEHVGTELNKAGSEHCYITSEGYGEVEVEGEFRTINPGTLVYFPSGTPHRLRAINGPLYYTEIQAWGRNSFQTNILRPDPLGKTWYYFDTGEEWIQG